MCESLLPSRLPWGHLLSQLFHLIYKRLYYVHSCCWFWNATKLDSKIYLISGLIRISLLFAIGLNFKSTTAAAAAVASVVSDSVRPHRRQPTSPHLPWDSPGKNTGVGCHFLLHCRKVKVKSLSRVRPLATPWTAAYQAPLPMGFFRQEYWSGVPLPSPLNALIHFKWWWNDWLIVSVPNWYL